MGKILVMDFGGQYNQLIARRVREQHVYAEIKPYHRMTPDLIRAEGYKGIIFTGGPNSVYDPASPRCDKAVLDLGIPILGICYGAQLLAYLAGGMVTGAGHSSEYGKTALYVSRHPLFKDIPAESICWMSHTDYISSVPPGFTAEAHTQKCPCAAMCDDARRLYGVQFHPEVTHTAYGTQLLRNFLFGIWVTLLPKVQVDIVVSKVPVRQVIETAKQVLHTGHIGDGKIFVTDVENVVRVRTGEEGYDALQSD